MVKKPTITGGDFGQGYKIIEMVMMILCELDTPACSDITWITKQKVSATDCAIKATLTKEWQYLQAWKMVCGTIKNSGQYS